MATNNPQPPPPPQPPPRSNETAIAVLIGVIAVVCLFVLGGILVMREIAGNIHVRETRNGAQDQVAIESPLGSIHVNQNDDNAKVEIRSPFGSVKVNSTPDLSQLGLEIYPGAALVKQQRDSAFHHGVQIGSAHENSPANAQVELQSGNKGLEIAVAEFRTAATPDQVLAFYQKQLSKFGQVARKVEDGGAVTLRVKVAHDNERAAAVKSGRDGTHFVLVRVRKSSAAR